MPLKLGASFGELGFIFEITDPSENDPIFGEIGTIERKTADLPLENVKIACAFLTKVV